MNNVGQMNIFVLLAAGLSSPLLVAEQSDNNDWLFSGDIRAGWVDYDYDNPNGDADNNKGHTDSKGIYVVPKLSIQTPDVNGFKAKVTVAGVTDFGINDPEKETRNFAFDPNELESYALLQEAFVSYTSADEDHSVLVGRNEITTPMVEADDYYYLANSFEVANYTNQSLDNTMFTAGYFNKMAGVWDSGANGTEFHSMSDASFVAAADKERAGDEGVSYLGAQYDNDTHSVQLWGYHAQDLYNILFAQYDLNQKTRGGFNYDLGAQYINFQEEGELADNSDTTIDFSMYSARFNGSFDNGIGFATGATKYSDGEGQGATLGAWGAYPYFANGMIYHFFEAGSLRNAASYKVQGSYDLGKVGLENFDIAVRYTLYDLDSKYSYSSASESQDEMALLGLQLAFDAGDSVYFKMTYEHRELDREPGADNLRLFGGYRF